MGVLTRIARRCLPAVLSALLSATPALADQMQLDATKVKAGLVYNLLKYTRWQKSSPVMIDKKLTVCLYGGDPFNGALDPLQGRTAQQLAIDIIETEDPNAITDCSLVIIHRSEADSVPTLLKTLDRKSILTISDIDDFTHEGGMVAFTRDENRVALVLNVPAIQAAGLIVEDRLIKLAKKEGQ